MKDLRIPYENLAKSNQPFMLEIESAVNRVIRKGWYVLGSEVESFEHSYAEYHGVSHCVGVNSGLDALVLSLKALDLPPDSEVIVPSNTYIATILSILQLGHRPVLVEPDLRTYNVDPGRIRSAITRNTGAIMVVHLYGKPCEMDPIMEICNQYNLPLIEDCAQAHGALYRGRKTGTFGMGAHSFYPTKNLGAMGDAGAVTTSNPAWADRIRMFRNYGSRRKYHNEVVGLNSRLDEVQAAVLNVKLKHLDEINRHKRELASIYFSELSGVDTLTLPFVSESTTDVYHIFNIRTPRRAELRDHLISHGIGTEIHYPVSPHRQEAMKPFLGGNEYPISEEIHRTTLSLPASFGHSVDDVAEVCAVIRDFFRN